MVGASLLVTLIERLIALGHEVVAYTTDPALRPRLGEQITARGPSLTVHYVPRRRHAFRRERGAWGRMVDLFGLERRALTKAMREDPPELVHAHWSYEFGAAAIDSGLPCLLTCHDSPNAILSTMRDSYRLGRWLMARRVLHHARNVSVVSPYLASQLRNQLRVVPTVVPNPMPDSIMVRGRDRGGRDFGQSPPRLAMMLNGWAPRKNPVPGMQAMLKVQDAFPRAELHLFGPGFGLGEAAEIWAKAAGAAARFVFHGRLRHQVALEALDGMDLLLHPALEESFGMTLGEAMALGIPVIAGANSGAVPWVTNQGEAGALVDVRSAEAIANAAIDLLKDAERYRLASGRGRGRALGMFSTAAVTEAYLGLYDRVLGAGG